MSASKFGRFSTLGAVVCMSALGLSLVACQQADKAQQSSEAATVAASPSAPKSNTVDENGLGTKFTYEELKTPSYDASKVDLTPNANSVVDQNKSEVVLNDVQYNFDTMSGATPRYVRTLDAIKVDQDLKNKRMHWTVQPPLGIIKGEFYRASRDFNEGYIATTDLVIDDGKIVHLEMDERGPEDYYEEKWANETKRRSGYGFFQSQSPRTHETLMVTPNAFNYLEWQILKNNSLNLPLQGVRGISNSARDAFIPEVQELKDTIQNPSGKFFTSITLPVEQGINARLQLIFEGNKIVEASYDEIFADDAKDIKDEALKKYYRTSKLQGIDYETDKPEFREMEKAIVDTILEKQSLDVELSGKLAEMPEYKNYKDLAAKLQPTVDTYLKEGQKHNIGEITKEIKPAGDFTPIYYRTDKLEVQVKDSVYDKAAQSITVEFDIKNVDDKPVTVLSDWFFLYVANAKHTYDSIGAPQSQSWDLAAGESKTVSLEFHPLLEGDKLVTFKYDGPNKTYVELGELEKLKTK